MGIRNDFARLNSIVPSLVSPFDIYKESTSETDEPNNTKILLMNAFEMIANNKNNTNFACHCRTDVLYLDEMPLGCCKLLCERAKIINAVKLSETRNGTKIEAE